MLASFTPIPTLTPPSEDEIRELEARALAGDATVLEMLVEAFRIYRLTSRPRSLRRRWGDRLDSKAGTRRLHELRRQLKLCINDETHGPAKKGGRCDACWETKCAAERAAYAKKKQGAL